MRGSAVVALAAGLILAVAACSSANPTEIVIYTTPTPTAAPTPTPVATPTPAPTPAPTAAPTPTPAAASATPTATPTAKASPSGSPGATPSGPAAGCTGVSDPLKGADRQAFWTATANNESFTVYCGVVPNPWYFSGASSTYGKTGLVTATYQTTTGFKIAISEGTFTAIDHGSSISTASFGDLSGQLYAGTSSGFVLLVNPGTSKAYQAVGTGVSQATFTKLAAALIKVPKS